MYVGVRRTTTTQNGRSKGQLRLCIQIQLQAPATVPSSSESPAGGMVLHATVSAGKLSDLHPMGGFLGVLRVIRESKGRPGCAVLVLIIFCLTVVLISYTFHSA